MIDREELHRQMMLVRCNRCGTRKEREKFSEQALKCSWNHWCIKCENTPIGQLAQPFEDM